jgi:hypothetical protein
MLRFKIAIAWYIAIHVCLVGVILYFNIVHADVAASMPSSELAYPIAGLITCNILMVADLTHTILRMVAFLGKDKIT